VSESAEAREWYRIIPGLGAGVLGDVAAQSTAGPVTVEALETILARATVPILRQVEVGIRQQRRPRLTPMS
jgi:hypothetical protein